MQTSKYLGIAAIAVCLLGGATADSREYVNLTGDQQIVCDDTGASLSEGGFCYPTGHIVADSNGEATLSVLDDLINPASGLFCQDLDGDTFCDTVGFSFCGALTLLSGYNWDQSGSIIVFLDGPVWGNPATSSCGTLSSGVHGFGSHS